MDALMEKVEAGAVEHAQFTLLKLVHRLEEKEGRRITLVELARDMKISYPTLHGIANNTTNNTSVAVLVKILDYFWRKGLKDIGVGDLLAYRGPDNST